MFDILVNLVTILKRQQCIGGHVLLGAVGGTKSGSRPHAQLLLRFVDFSSNHNTAK